METTFFDYMPVRVGKTVLENGLTVLTAETGSAFVFAKMVFRTGGVDDTGHSGLAHLIEHLVCKDGTRERHPLILELQGREVDYNAGTSPTATQFHFDGLAEEQEVMADSLFRLCFGRAFKDADVETERPVVLAEYHQRKRTFAVQRAVDQALFGIEEPWTFMPIGTEEGIRSITAADINARLELDYHVGNAALVMCGGVKHEAVVEMAERLSASMRGFGRRALPSPPAHRIGIHDLRLPNLGATPSVMVLWRIRDPELLPHPQDIAMQFISGVRFGRLYKRLRVELGIAYGVQTDFSMHDRHCGVGAVTDSDKFPLIEGEIRSVIQALAEQGVGAEEHAAVERGWRLGSLHADEKRSGPASFRRWAESLSGMWINEDYRYLRSNAPFLTREEIDARIRDFARQEWTMVRILG